MGIGRLVSDTWRGAFVNLDAFTHEIKARIPSPTVLEIGRGDRGSAIVPAAGHSQ
jgi:hypothetical protein